MPTVRRSWLTGCLALPLVLAAAPSWAQTSPIHCAPATGADPICELWAETGAPLVPWSRWSSWPVLLLPSWRYDRLCADAARLPVCEAGRDGDRRVAEARLAAAIASEAERTARERARADAAEAGLGVPLSYWLGAAGAVALAAVLGGVIGADPLGLLPWGG